LLVVWVTLAWTSPGDAARGAAQLIIATAAILLAFAHTSPDVLDRLDRIPGAHRLVQHLLSTSGRNTVDASGLGEGLGILVSAWLYVGPFPLESLGPAARTVGLTLAIVYGWEAVLQSVIDPSWYNPDPEPTLAMRRFRWLIAPIFGALIALVIFPYNPTAAQVPVPAVAILSATPLLYYPIWAAFDVLLRASVNHAYQVRLLWQQDTASDLHSQVKTSAGLLQRYAEQPDASIGEIRSLARELLVRVEEMRRDVLAPEARAAERPFGDLWDTVLRIMPAQQRRACILSEGSAGVALSAADYQIARRVLPDLVSNALNAGAGQVSVTCALTGSGDETDRVHLTVADNGPGVETAELDARDSSLRHLHARLARLHGGIEFSRSGSVTVTRTFWSTAALQVPAVASFPVNQANATERG
jgi:signal transduction histidine kinase